MARPSLDVIGQTGLKRYGGIIDEEWHNRLKGRLGVIAYREMSDNDSVVGAILWAIESLVRQVAWPVEASGDTPKHLEQKEFVEGAMNDMSHTWPEFLAEVLSMLIYGWSYFEISYKIRRSIEAKDPRLKSKFSDGKFGWRKIGIRAQESLYRWEIDDEGGIQGLWQQPPPNYQTIFVPIEKSILFRTKAHKNNPEGRSVLRNSYRSWFYLKRIQESEAIGIDRHLAGMPVLEVPFNIMDPDGSDDDKALRATLEKLIQEVRWDERAGLLLPSETNEDGKPSGYRFRLLASSGRRPGDSDAIVKRYQRDIAMSVLAEFLMLGSTSTGSFALASTKTELFAVALGSILDTITATFNRFAVDKLMAFNGVPQEFWPRLTHGDLETRDLGELADFVVSLTSVEYLTNNPPDEEIDKKLRTLGDLPQRKEKTVEKAEEDEEDEDETEEAA